MKTYFNPEMNITKFHREAVATTASSALAEWKEDEASETRTTRNVKFSEMTIVGISF